MVFSGLLLWLAILFPLLFLTESRLLNNVWFLGVVATVVLWNFENFREDSIARQVFTTLSLPYLVIALGYLIGARSVEFGLAARMWGFATLLLPFAVGGNIAWSLGNHNYLEKSLSLGMWPLLPIGSALLAGITAQSRNFKRGVLITNAIYLVLASSIVLSIPPLTIPLDGKHPIIGCGLFILGWSGAAAIAAGMDRRRLFDIAALVIGIRFIVVYFQVFGSLAATGFGLIVSGAVILGIAYCWYKFRSQVAKALREAV